MTVSHDQNIALGAIRKKLDKLFKDKLSVHHNENKICTHTIIFLIFITI